MIVSVLWHLRKFSTCIKIYGSIQQIKIAKILRFHT